jgi:hypothetical protein
VSISKAAHVATPSAFARMKRTLTTRTSVMLAMCDRRIGREPRRADVVEAAVEAAAGLQLVESAKSLIVTSQQSHSV